MISNSKKDFKSIVREKTKYLHKGYYKLSQDGTKHLPLNSQLYQYMNQPKKNENDAERAKEKVQQFLRRRLRNSMPKELLKQIDERSQRQQNSDYLTGKHTYSSMRKVSEMKSRKKFYFDDGDEEEKKRQQRSHESSIDKIEALRLTA